MQALSPVLPEDNGFQNPDEHFTAGKNAMSNAEKSALITLLSMDSQKTE